MVGLLLGDDIARLVPQFAAFRVEGLRGIEMRVRQLEIATIGDLAGPAHVALRSLLAGFGVTGSPGLLIAPLAGLFAGSLFRGQLVGDAPIFLIAGFPFHGCGRRGGCSRRQGTARGLALRFVPRAGRHRNTLNVPAVGLGVLAPTAQLPIDCTDLGTDAVTLNALDRAPGPRLLIALLTATLPQGTGGGEQDARRERARRDSCVHITVTDGLARIGERRGVGGMLGEQLREPVRGGFDRRVVALRRVEQIAQVLRGAG